VKRLSKIKRARLVRETLAFLGIAAAIILGSLMATRVPSFGSGHDYGFETLGPAEPADPTKVLGNDACVKCHASEQAVWANTPHSKTFDELHRRPEAAQIASKLGIKSIKHGDRCVACHYTRQAEGGAGHENAITAVSRNGSRSIDFHAIAGISCESCHGAARDWLQAHHDYGGPDVTRLTESPAHREQRIKRSVELGMRNPHNVYLVAQSCYRCHTTGDEELVNVGGHPAGSLDFELVAWSQGMIHHNFVRTDGKANVVSSPNRLRFLFIAGVIADTEASLRAVSTATEKANYALTVAKRAARAGARLQSVAEKVGDARLDEAVQVFESVTIKLNNQQNLVAAADQLAKIGYQLANAETDPQEETLREKLIVLDRFIPAAKTWK
jgi:hypothetical protein